MHRGLRKPPGNDGPADTEDSDGALSSDNEPADAEDSDGALSSDVADKQQKEEMKTEIDDADAAHEWEETGDMKPFGNITQNFLRAQRRQSESTKKSLGAQSEEIESEVAIIADSRVQHALLGS